MPHISIKMYPGRSEEVKKDIAVKTRDFLVEEMEMDAKYFSVSVEEVEKEKWQEEVVDKIDGKDLYVEANF
ncbi:MAG: tautomerase family protein [Dorea sp.]|nr:tautomerase family protein [Dorea sp.]